MAALAFYLEKKKKIVIIEITDNGSGINDAEKLPRLFEPYYTSKRNGIGLGFSRNFKYYTGTWRRN